MVLRPVVGVDVRGHARPLCRPAPPRNYLNASYRDSTALVLGVRALLDEIVWDDDLTDQAEAAWERLGQRPGI